MRPDQTHRYLYVSPRGFCNEFSIYRVPVLEMATAAIWASKLPEAARWHWITLREALLLLARERANARENRRAGLNAHENPTGAHDFTEWRDRP